MTDDQKYQELLKEIGELLAEKNNYVKFKEYELDRVKRLLEIAEKKIEEMQKEQ